MLKVSKLLKKASGFSWKRHPFDGIEWDGDRLTGWAEVQSSDGHTFSLDPRGEAIDGNCPPDCQLDEAAHIALDNQAMDWAHQDVDWDDVSRIAPRERGSQL